MKHTKLPLADLLTLLTALGFSFICFLGKNFSTMGNTTVSIIWASIITLLLAGTAFLAKSLKRTSGNFKTNFILELIVLVLFTGLTVYFAYSIFPHYFNVSANKTEIQGKLKTSITQAENMFTEYENYAQNREAAFKGSLSAAVRLENPGELRKYDFKTPGEVPYSTQIEHKLSTLHTDLLPSNYSDTANKNGIKEVATSWLAKAKSLTDSWKPISIVSVVNNIEQNSNDWLTQLIGFSQQVSVKGAQEDPAFVHTLTFDDVKSLFTTPGKPTALSIALAVGAYLLMLVSYLIASRSSKSNIGRSREVGEYDIEP